jgi:hypothetical protein
MTYQFPLSSNHAAADMTQHAYMPEYTIQEGPPGSGGSRGNPGAPMASSRDAGMAPRRSLSTPVDGIRQDSTPEKQLSAGEKKRTKLGYHRTSIACNHCRRRKIRCITSADTRDKCSNCIRLKKDCNFTSVEQQAAADPRPKTQSRSSVGTRTASMSSPSSIADGSVNDIQPYPVSEGMGLPPGHSPDDSLMQRDGARLEIGQDQRDAMLTTSTEDAPNEPLTSRPFVTGAQAVPDWTSANVDSNAMLNHNDPHASWRHYSMGGPGHANFPGYSQAPPGASVWSSGPPESSAREEMNWADYPPPIRSSSYSGGAINGQQHGAYMADHRGSAGFPGIYPPPGSTVESTPGPVLVSPGGMPNSMMVQGSWQGAAGRSNGHVLQSNGPDHYETWGYIGRGGGH